MLSTGVDTNSCVGSAAGLAAYGLASASYIANFIWFPVQLYSLIIGLPSFYFVATQGIATYYTCLKGQAPPPYAQVGLHPLTGLMHSDLPFV